MEVKGTGSCMKGMSDNFYARFYIYSYHCCSESTLVLDKVNFDSHWSVKCRSKAAGHGAGSKSI